MLIELNTLHYACIWLQPDITAPGVEILAAYSEIVSPSSSSQDMRRAKYNILSETSMACPHVSGVAAYAKTFHPDWSASAIKSAIMTTGNLFYFFFCHLIYFPTQVLVSFLKVYVAKLPTFFIVSIASPMNATKILAAEFVYGSGQINPTKAVDPGLVYDTSKEDYINLLCSLGYDEKNLRLISGDNSTCPEVSTKTLARDLNYPQ